MTVYFTGASSHTALGDNLEKAVTALGQVPEPGQAVLSYADQRQSIPYLLLPDVPLQNIEQRLYSVLEGVIGEALDKAGLNADERRNLGLFLGTSSADVSVSEARFQRELLENSETATALIGSNSIANLARWLRRQFDLRGPDYSFNTACTASANALMSATDMIEAGHLEHALVVSVELFNVVTAAGFYGLGLLSPQIMRPFDQDRSGLTLGEGCSALVLSTQPRSARDFRLAGGASMCDIHGMSATNPDGSTVEQVINQALARAGVSAAEISAIKVHGTASLHNDEAEVAGMQRVFGEDVPPSCALKPYIGHTLGACGLNEVLLFCAAADAGFVPGTPGIASPARADLGIALTQSNQALTPGPLLLNYFGFGGNNTSLVITGGEGAA